jgi:ankyrin repeat protein
MKAAFWGNREAVGALLSAGADSEARSSDGRTAADLAEEVGQLHIAGLLRRAAVSLLNSRQTEP